MLYIWAKVNAHMLFDGVKATKWSEWKEAVAELTKLASTKRIAPGDFTEVSWLTIQCYLMGLCLCCGWSRVGLLAFWFFFTGGGGGGGGGGSGAKDNEEWRKNNK